MSDGKTAVVFDVNVFVDALVGPDSTYPRIVAVPPTTSNAAADAISLAFDAEEFILFVSPHILRNTAKVLKRLRLSADVVEKYIAAIQDIVDYSGGQVIDPPRVVFDVRDFEDNLVLDLAVDVDALIVVSADTDLTSMSPWNGRLFLHPRIFVSRTVQARRSATQRPPKPGTGAPASGRQGRVAAGSAEGGQFRFKDQSDPEINLEAPDQN